MQECFGIFDLLFLLDFAGILYLYFQVLLDLAVIAMSNTLYICVFVFYKFFTEQLLRRRIS